MYLLIFYYLLCFTWKTEEELSLLAEYGHKCACTQYRVLFVQCFLMLVKYCRLGSRP
jgi:hypothetical protein